MFGIIKKKKICATVYEITEDKYYKLLDKIFLDNAKFKKSEKKLFLYIVDSSTYLGIDNTDGDCFVEEFRTKNDALIWLLSLQNAEAIQEAASTIQSWC